MTRVLALALLLLAAPGAAALTVAEHSDGPEPCAWRMTYVDTDRGPWAEGSSYCQEGEPASQVAVWSDEAYVVWWGRPHDAAVAVGLFGVQESERLPLGPPNPGWGDLFPLV